MGGGPLPLSPGKYKRDFTHLMLTPGYEDPKLELILTRSSFAFLIIQPNSIPVLIWLAGVRVPTLVGRFICRPETPN